MHRLRVPFIKAVQKMLVISSHAEIRVVSSFPEKRSVVKADLMTGKVAVAGKIRQLRRGADAALLLFIVLIPIEKKRSGPQPAVPSRLRLFDQLRRPGQHQRVIQTVSAVQKKHIISIDLRQSLIHAVVNSPVRAAENTHPAVRRQAGSFRRHVLRQGAVRGAAVLDDDFKIPVFLAEHAFYGFGQFFPGIEGYDHDTKKYMSHSATPFP